MSSFTDDAKKVFDLVLQGLRGVELIGNIGRAQFGTNKGADALATIDAIVKVADAIKGGFDGTIEPGKVQEHIDAQVASFEAGLAAIDADDQAAIDKKFPTG